jgi:proteasome lid subunit RPN8/RPN11
VIPVVTCIEIPARLLAAIAARAAAAWPGECCGLLLGRREGDARIVAEAVAADNVADDPARRFEVDPRVLLATHRRARETGIELLGPYHSHPDGAAVPSATDRARAIAAVGTGEAWLIVPVTRQGAGDARAFVFDGRGFAEAALVVTPDQP